MAAMVGNRREQELDIVLLSTKDGSVVRNLTKGFDQGMGFAYISTPGGRWNTVSWMSWSPVGDQLAYFVRTEKEKTLILQDVVSTDIKQRFPMKTVDEPESPSIAPGGRFVAFSGLRNAIGDIYLLDTTSGEITNLTDDAFADYAPTFSPDGKSIVYLARISGNEKLFSYDLATKKKTQLTFGTHDEGQAKFIDGTTLVFPSTAVNPTQPIEPEVARNGNIFNIWTLSLVTGELRQYTDAAAGNVSPVLLTDDKVSRVAFVTYYKGEWGVHTLERKEPIQTAMASDFGEAGGAMVDFQPPMTHTLVKENQKEKGTFEKMFLDGRPPVNVGVTSGGDLFGGTQVTFSDVLGDKQFNVFAASISQYRTFSLNYTNLSRRFQYALQGFSQEQFFYGTGSYFYDPAYNPIFLDRDNALATRTMRGGSAFGIYPFDRYRRIEMFGSVINYNERYNDPTLEEYSNNYQEELYGTQLFRERDLGAARRGLRAGDDGVPRVRAAVGQHDAAVLRGGAEDRRTRCRTRPPTSTCASTSDWAARACWRCGARCSRAGATRRTSPTSAATRSCAGTSTSQFTGHNVFFFNAELRFPLIEAMLTPLGVMGGVRGVFFFGTGAAYFNEQPYQFATSKTESYTPYLGSDVDPATGTPIPIYGPPVDITGFRLRDGKASYGFGLETFALGFPIHFDWAWRTTFNREWEDALYASVGGSEEFRRAAVQGVDWVRLLTQMCRGARCRSASAVPGAAVLSSVGRGWQTLAAPSRVTSSHFAHFSTSALRDTGTSNDSQASLRLPHRNRPRRPAQRRQPAGVHPGRHGDAPDRHGRRDCGPPPRARADRDGRRRRPAVPASHHGGRLDHPARAGERGVHHVDGGGGRGVLGSQPHRRAPVDQPRVSDVCDRGQNGRTPGGAAAAAGDRGGTGARRRREGAAGGAAEETGVGCVGRKGVGSKQGCTPTPLRTHSPTPYF